MDTTNHCTVHWNKGGDTSIATYHIRANRTVYNSSGTIINVEDILHIQPSNEIGKYTFTIPSIYYSNIILYTYDNANNLIYAAPVWHTPIRVLATNVSGHSQLAIQRYRGLEYNMYYVYRGTMATNMALYDSLPHTVSGLENYYDNEANSYGSYYYKVSIKPMVECANNSDTIFSNIVHLSTVGLSEQQALLNAIAVYPNPTQNILTINLGKASAEGATIQVLNTLGQVVKTQMFDKTAGQKLTTDVTILPAGFYFVQVQAFGGSKAFRVVKN